MLVKYIEKNDYQTDDIPNELFRRLYPITSLLYHPSNVKPKGVIIKTGKATGIFFIREVEENEEEEDEAHTRELVKEHIRNLRGNLEILADNEIPVC